MDANTEQTRVIISDQTITDWSTEIYDLENEIADRRAKISEIRQRISKIVDMFPDLAKELPGVAAIDQQILSVLESNPDGLGPSEIRAALRRPVSAGHVGITLSRLKREGKVVCPSRGIYVINDTAVS